MRAFTILLLVFSLLLFTATAFAVIGPNMVYNSDFEIDDNEDGIPDGWGCLNSGGSMQKLIHSIKRRVSTYAHSQGKRWCKQLGCHLAKYPCPRGATYQIKVKIKLERLEGDADYFWVGGYAFKDMPLDSSNFITGPAVITPVKSDDFVSYVQTFVMPPGDQVFPVSHRGLYTSSADVVLRQKHG